MEALLEDKDPQAETSTPFATPIKLAQINYTHFEMREATVEDMFSAEMELTNIGAGAHTPLVFNGHMMIRQMTKVTNGKGDEFTGPFTMNMLKSWGPRNYRAIRTKQVEIDLLGEA
jgi:phage FluMu protein gp41